MPSPPVTSGLVLNLDSRVGLYQDSAITTPAVSDGDPVGGWTDNTANANNALQTTSAYRPKLKLNVFGGQNGIRFDGSASFLSLGQPASLANAIVGSADWTLYLRVIAQNPGGQNETIISRTTVSDGHLLFLMVNQNNVLNNGGAEKLAPGGAMLGEVLGISYTYTHASGTAIIGSGGNYAPSATAATSGAATNIVLGAASGASPADYYGRIDLLSVLAYNRALSTAELGQLDAYYRGVNSEPPTFRYLLGCDGNSITYGDAATSGPNAYVQQMAAILGIPSYAVFGFGWEGITTVQCTTNAPARVDPLFNGSALPGILTFFEGINDMGASTGAQSYSHTVSYLSARRTSLPAKTKLITATVTHNNSESNATVDAYNALIRADFSVATSIPYLFLPGPGVTYCDAMVDLQAVPQLSNNSNSTYFADGTHWADAGHLIAAQTLAPAVRMFSPSPSTTGGGEELMPGLCFGFGFD